MFFAASLCSILVEGCDPYSEDLWTEIKISGFSFQGVKLCSRCKVKSSFIIFHILCSLEHLPGDLC